MTPGELWRRLWYMLNRRRIERELDEEMATHREMMNEPRQFGNQLKLREISRDAWGWGWLDRAWQDLRGAIRVLRRAPVFTVTAVLILSAGIGLNLTFFNLLNVTTLQPLEIRDPDTLVRFERRTKTSSSSGVPYPATQVISRHNDVLSAVLTARPSDVIWEDDTESQVPALFVSANWFSELGYGATAGRTFSEEIDGKPDASPSIVVSHDFWRGRLGSDPEIVGRRMRVNDRLATVIGVAPAAFPDLNLKNPGLWLLIHQVDHFEPGSTFKDDWTSNATQLYARVRPGVSPSAAQDGLRAAISELARLRPQEFQPDEWLEPASGADRFLSARERREVGTVAALIGALTILVLAVASANLGNLVLSHAIGRLREFSVRAALGASRWRILRHILVECGLLAAGGAAGGIAVGLTGARLFASVTGMPSYLDFTPDWRLFAAAFIVAFVAMLAFGLVPAWMVSRRDLIRAMKDGGHQASSGLARARVRLALVAVQVVGCCALLIVASSMTRGLQKLLVADPGFTFDRVAVLHASLGRHGVRGEPARAYWDGVLQTITAHPDVEGTALAYPEPLGSTVNQSSYGPDTGALKISVMHVEPAFFSLLEIPLLAGRHFGPADDQSVVIISRQVAMTMYGGLDVLGRGYPRTRPTRTVIGIAGDAQLVQIRADNSAAEYMPIDPGRYDEAVLLARSRTNPGNLIGFLRAAATAADSRVLPSTRLLAREYELKLKGPTLASTIAGVAATLVLTLACLGIFGVVAYAVKLRTKEIGIRRALGADAPRVVAALLRQLFWPVGLGMAVGVAAGLLASRLLSGDPFYLAVTEAPASAAALVVFALAALAAAIVPASRALNADPIRALRHE